MKGVLPASILNRPKMGFPVPFARLDARRAGTASSRDVLLDRRTRERGIIDPRRRRARSSTITPRAATDGGDAIWSAAQPRALVPHVHRRRAASQTLPRSLRHRAELTSMRILWLKSDLLLPLDKGGKLRTWH